VGFFELFDGGGIVSELAIVDADRADVLPPIFNRPLFTFAPHLPSRGRRGDTERQQHDKNRHQHPDQQEALFAAALPLHHCASSGRVWRLLLGMSSTTTEFVPIEMIL